MRLAYVTYDMYEHAFWKHQFVNPRTSKSSTIKPVRHPSAVARDQLNTTDFRKIDRSNLLLDFNFSNMFQKMKTWNEKKMTFNINEEIQWSQMAFQDKFSPKIKTRLSVSKSPLPIETDYTAIQGQPQGPECCGVRFMQSAVCPWIEFKLTSDRWSKSPIHISFNFYHNFSPK